MTKVILCLNHTVGAYNLSKISVAASQRTEKDQNSIEINEWPSHTVVGLV